MPAKEALYLAQAKDDERFTVFVSKALQDILAIRQEKAERIKRVDEGPKTLL